MPVSILDAPVITPVGLPGDIVVSALGSGVSDRCLVVIVSGDQSVDAVGLTSLTYGGVAMTLLADADTAATTVITQIWVLFEAGLSSAVGTALVGAGAVVDGASTVHVTLKDANQSLPTNTVAVAQSGTSGAVSLARVADSITIAAHTHGALELSAISSPSSMQSVTVSASSLVVGIETDTSRVVDVGWTNAFDRAHTIAAINIGPVAAGDTVPPSIELLGDSTVTFESGNAGNYIDAGANSVDNVDPTELIAPDNLPTDYIGVQLLNFNDADVAGNNAPQVQRTVNVTVPAGRQYITLDSIPVTLSDTNLLAQYEPPDPEIGGQIEAPLTTNQGLAFTLLGNGEVSFESPPTEDQTISGFLYISPAGERGVSADFNYVFTSGTAPTITTVGSININENAPLSQSATIINRNGNLPTLSGDVDGLSIDLVSGDDFLLTHSGYNYDLPSDAGNDNTYDVTIHIDNGVDTEVTHHLPINVFNINEQLIVDAGNGSAQYPNGSGGLSKNSPLFTAWVAQFSNATGNDSAALPATLTAAGSPYVITFTLDDAPDLVRNYSVSEAGPVVPLPSLSSPIPNRIDPLGVAIAPIDFTAYITGADSYQLINLPIGADGSNVSAVACTPTVDSNKLVHLVATNASGSSIFPFSWVTGVGGVLNAVGSVLAIGSPWKKISQ